MKVCSIEYWVPVGSRPRLCTVWTGASEIDTVVGTTTVVYQLHSVNLTAQNLKLIVVNILSVDSHSCSRHFQIGLLQCALHRAAFKGYLKASSSIECSSMDSFRKAHVIPLLLELH